MSLTIEPFHSQSVSSGDLPSYIRFSSYNRVTQTGEQTRKTFPILSRSQRLVQERVGEGRGMRRANDPQELISLPFPAFQGLIHFSIFLGSRLDDRKW